MKFTGDIKNAVKVLRDGGIILYPTDTIWGIGCDATNSQAIKRVFDIKMKSDHKSLLVLVNSVTTLERYVRKVPDIAYDLIEVSLAPLTIIYPEGRNLAPELIADDGSVGIRVVKEPFSEALIQQFRIPIVSTSANISGDSSPANFSEVKPEIRNAVDYIVQWRQDDTSRGVASSIIKIREGGDFEILR